MVKIVKFVNVIIIIIIIFLFLFHFSMSIRSKHFFYPFQILLFALFYHIIIIFSLFIAASWVSEHVPCILHASCSKNMCKPPFNPRCVEWKCVCRFW
jgi:magnesium-transporting ATPase (P-type)